jgi:fatty acyl-ACP thioesterase B
VNSGGKAAVTDGEDDASRSSTPTPRTFYNQLPDWSVLLAAITTIFLAAERQWTLVDWKPKRPDMLIDTFGFNGQVFRQDFSIRSYEIGADRTASIETLMNHLQVSHVRQ